MSFLDNGDGTITGNTTGLQWQKEDDGVERDYEQAEDYVHKLDLGSHNDWRLPEKEELIGLIKIGGEQIQKTFANLKNERYWAKTRPDDLYWAENPERIAYTVDFDPSSGNHGRAITYFKIFKYYVRAVRDAD